MEQPVPPKNKWKFAFSNRTFDAIQAMTAEKVNRELREGGTPSPSDLSTLRWREPFLCLRSPEEIGVLAARLQDFVEDTEAAVTDIKCDWPPDVANTMVDERMKRADIATGLIVVLQQDMSYAEILEADGSDPDDWLNGTL